jgi:predicted nucleotidyltransferase
VTYFVTCSDSTRHYLHGDQTVGVATLLGSSSSLRVAGLLFLNPEREYTLAALGNAVGDEIGRRTLIRTLNDLVSDALVKKTSPRYGYPAYRANTRHFLYDELRGIAIKTLGGVGSIAEVIAADPNVEVAVIFGSHAAGSARNDSDIDLLLFVADPERDEIVDLLTALDRAGHVLGRAINPILMTRREWADRMARAEPFARRVSSEPVMPLKGEMP